MAQGFANVVAVLMRDPGFRSLRLADLEWLVLPPVLSGQWRIGRSRTEQSGAGSTVPTAVALWASVSPEIDRRLSSDLDKPLLLRPNEWATGDIVWLVALAGDRRALPKFLARLRATEFKGRQVKLRTNGPDGKVVVKTLGPSDTAVAAG